MKTLLVDFEDSFTFNIASELKALGFEVKVIHYSDFSEYMKNTTDYRFTTVFGPGPGHPDDYCEIFSEVEHYFINNEHPFMGICLGHQIFWRVKGAKIIESKNKVHGEAESITVPKWSCFRRKYWDIECKIQRYNSLVVDGVKSSSSRSLLLSKDDELLMACENHVITYQFHPESVGTSFPEVFFGPLLKMRYNNRDGRAYKSKRNLR